MSPHVPICIRLAFMPLLLGVAFWANLKAVTWQGLKRTHYYASICSLSLVRQGVLIGLGAAVAWELEDGLDAVRVLSIALVLGATIGGADGLAGWVSVQRSAAGVRKWTQKPGKGG